MDTHNPREAFDRQLRLLQEDILVLGDMVRRAILESLDALQRRDLQAAEKICANDLRINEKRYDIENGGLILIATQQPMAGDLRLLAAVLEINTELERMADYAKGIAKITMLLGQDDLPVFPIQALSRMANRGLDMLERALKAFVAEDSAAARMIPQEDDEIDEMYNQIFQDAVQCMIIEPVNVTHVNNVIWAAHNLERLADRVTNICERVIFWVEGEMHELDVVDCHPSR